MVGDTLKEQHDTIESLAKKTAEDEERRKQQLLISAKHLSDFLVSKGLEAPNDFSNMGVDELIFIIHNLSTKMLSIK